MFICRENQKNINKVRRKMEEKQPTSKELMVSYGVPLIPHVYQILLPLILLNLLLLRFQIQLMSLFFQLTWYMYIICFMNFLIISMNIKIIELLSKTTLSMPVRHRFILQTQRPKLSLKCCARQIMFYERPIIKGIKLT